MLTGMKLFSLVDLVLAVILLPSVTSHFFLGGTMSFEPVDFEPGDEFILSDILWKFRFRAAWNRSDEYNFCNQSIISSQVLLGDSHPENAFYCEDCEYDSELALGTAQYICSSYSKEEDWSAGENVFYVNFSSSNPVIYHYDCCWISGLLTYDEDYGLLYDRYYALLATFASMSAFRPDTGTVNASPVSAVIPLMRLRTGCEYSIRIHIEDPDGDLTRCRLAEESECEDGCVGKYGLNFTLLQQSPCVINFQPLEAIQGLHPVSLMIGDFGSDDQLLSYVSLAFVVDVVHGVGSHCTAYVAFEKSTVADGTCIGIEPNATFETTIYVKEEPCSSVIDIVLSAPVGVNRSDIIGQSPHKEMTIMWKPEPYQYGYNLLCFQASDDYAMYTEQRCITLVAGAAAFETVPQSASFNGSDAVPLSTASFTIEFDNDVFLPSVSRNITMSKTHLSDVLLDSLEVLVAFDTSVSELVNTTGRVLTFVLPVGIQLEQSTYYSIEIGFGAVVSKRPCSGGGVPFPGLDNWKFKTSI